MLSTCLALTPCTQQALRLTSMEYGHLFFRQVIFLAVLFFLSFNYFKTISKAFLSLSLLKTQVSHKECGFTPRKFHPVTELVYAVMD